MAALPVKKDFPSNTTYHLYFNPAISTLAKHVKTFVSNADITTHASLSEDEYKSVSNDLAALLKQPKSKWCDGVEIDYIEYIFANCNALFVAKSDSVFLGFCSIKLKKSAIHVDIICSNNEYKGVGSNLITAINDFGHDLEMNKVSLDSITDAVGFYLKMGYRCKDEVCPMDKEIETRIKPLTKKRNLTKTVKRSRPTVSESSKSKSIAVTSKRPRLTKAQAKSKTVRIQKAPRYKI